MPKRNEDGEITSTDGVGNNLAGVIISEGVDKNAGVDTMCTVASPFKSRMGDMGVLEESKVIISWLLAEKRTVRSDISKKEFNLYILG